MTFAEMIADIQQSSALGTQHATRILPALGQHVHIELTLANVVPVAIQALQEKQKLNKY